MDYSPGKAGSNTKKNGEQEKEKLNDQLASLNKRVGKAREKLQQAELESSEHIAAFKTGLEKMETKLITTQAELTRLQKENQ